jgi:DNA-binding MarR family transcriptional regulator
MSRNLTRRNRAAARDGIDEHVERATREFPEIDPAVEGIVSRIDKLARYLTRSMGEALARHDLGEGEYKVLVKLQLAGEPYRMSPGDLSRILLLSTGAMTNRLDGLEQHGLVQRLPDPHDRRGVLVQLTAKGRDVLAAAVHEQAARESRLMEVLGDDEKEDVTDLLRKLLIHLEELLGPAPRRRDQAES